MKNIIVAVDFSGGSIHALKYAIKLANSAKANIIMVWVDKTSEPDSIYSISVESYRTEVVRRFNELTGQFRPEFTGGKLEYKLRKGKIYQEIVGFAQSKNADLIITGSHGVSGFEEYWIGSNANRIVAHAFCPVITVRNKFEIKDQIQKIVMPVDNSSNTLGKLNVTACLAKHTGAEIHLISIYSTNLKTMHKRVENFADKAIKYFEKESVSFVHEHFQTQNATKSVIDYAINIQADLIAIMTEQEDNQSNGIIGPNARQIVNHSPIPVLSVHAADANKTF
ncbi:MAG TPA: universal stress protein [Bacteroidales bacterium]|nr:universal stress protein [Bacteroidales bacterium]HRW96199.1 universal stress protein [Bacteroidales bacterium]